MASPLDLFSDPDKLKRTATTATALALVSTLELPPGWQPARLAAIALITLGEIFSSRWKEQAVAHAEAAKQDALASTTDEQAKAAIEAAVQAELARRAALKPPSIAPVAP